MFLYKGEIMDIILLLFVCPIVSAVVIIITIVNHVLLKKENKDIIEKAKKLDFVKRINNYVKIQLIVYLVFFIGIYALNVINEMYIRQNDINDNNELEDLPPALQDVINYTNTDDRYIYESLITVVQLFILIYVPTRVIANIILIIKLSSNEILNENERGIIKKYYTYKMIINICLGFIIFGAVSMMRFISSWAG